MAQVVTFGEALFRFSSKKGERLRSAHELGFYLGGSELNVAVNLVSLGIESEWVSVVPSGAMGELLLDRVAQTGVSFNHVKVIEAGGPIGWYMLESGAAPRPDRVLQRSSSVLASEKSFQFKWSEIFRGCRIFHTSGIAAGLSIEMGQEVGRALQEAKNASVLVSYDFNYRKALWTVEQSKTRQLPFLPLIDILFCSYADLELFFGWKPEKNAPADLFKSSRMKAIVVGHREERETQYGVDLLSPEGIYKSDRHPISGLDRIGIGDSMAAAFQASLLSSSGNSNFSAEDMKRAAQYGSAAGAMKYSIHGDTAGLRMIELKELVDGGYRAVQR